MAGVVSPPVLMIGAALSSDAPAGLLQHGHYMHLLHIFEVTSSVCL